MRIEAYTQVQQIYKASTTKATGTKKTAAASDRLEISGFGRDYQVAKKALAETPDVREERTAPLKKSVQSGTYQVSADNFADVLFAKYENSKEVR